MERSMIAKNLQRVTTQAVVFTETQENQIGSVQTEKGERDNA